MYSDLTYFEEEMPTPLDLSNSTRRVNDSSEAFQLDSSLQDLFDRPPNPLASGGSRNNNNGNRNRCVSPIAVIPSPVRLYHNGRFLSQEEFASQSSSSAGDSSRSSSSSRSNSPLYLRSPIVEEVSTPWLSPVRRSRSRSRSPAASPRRSRSRSRPTIVHVQAASPNISGSRSKSPSTVQQSSTPKRRVIPKTMVHRYGKSTLTFETPGEMKKGRIPNKVCRYLLSSCSKRIPTIRDKKNRKVRVIFEKLKKAVSKKS